VKKSLIFAFGMIGTIGFATVVPLVAFAFLGKYLDSHFRTGHNFFYTGIALAVPVIYLTVRQVAQSAIRDFDTLTNDKTKKK